MNELLDQKEDNKTLYVKSNKILPKYINLKQK